jgi:hypothetical protein
MAVGEMVTVGVRALELRTASAPAVPQTWAELSLPPPSPPLLAPAMDGLMVVTDQKIQTRDLRSFPSGS